MYVRGYLQGSENGRVVTIVPPGESANSDYRYLGYGSVEISVTKDFLSETYLQQIYRI
jgi:hypothetical protein